MLSSLVLLSYDTGVPVTEKGDVNYVKGVIHINETSETGPKPMMTKEDTYLHVLRVVMA